jgi:class 3 adenylate cyclase
MFLSDIRDLLASVAAPTLVMHTGDLALVSAAHARYLADHIPGAILMDSEVESFWGFDPASRQAMREFVSGIHDEVSFEQELLAVLFTDIVASTEQLFSLGDAAWRQRLDDHDVYVREQVTANHGRVIKHTGDGHLAAFAHPSDAIHAAVRIRDAAAVHGFEVRAGIHFGETAVRGDGDITGSTVNIAARVMEHAHAGQILVSRTFADLTAGSSIDLDDVGEHQLKGVPGQWRLFAVKG